MYGSRRSSSEVTMRDAFENWILRSKYPESQGYTVKNMWGCQWKVARKDEKVPSEDEFEGTTLHQRGVQRRKNKRNQAAA